MLYWCPQVEQILALRSDMMDAAEHLRRSEAERAQQETELANTRQQVKRKRRH